MALFDILICAGTFTSCVNDGSFIRSNELEIVVVIIVYLFSMKWWYTGMAFGGRLACWIVRRALSNKYLKLVILRWTRKFGFLDLGICRMYRLS